MTARKAPVIYVNGDPYVFDRASGEWVEQHHGHDDADAAAVRRYVTDQMARRVS